MFKTNDRPVDVGNVPEKGGECEIVSSIELHKKGLREIRDRILKPLSYPIFLLADTVLNEKEDRKKDDGKQVKKKKAVTEGSAENKEFLKVQTKLILDSRKFQNVVKACALKNIILRLIDKLERQKGGKRYFYRPISAIKSKHRLK